MANMHPKRGPGRPKKVNNKLNTELTLHETGPAAAALLQGVIERTCKATREEIDAAKYIVNQVCGAPCQKVESSGSVELIVRYKAPLQLQVVPSPMITEAPKLIEAASEPVTECPTAELVTGKRLTQLNTSSIRYAVPLERNISCANPSRA